MATKHLSNKKAPKVFKDSVSKNKPAPYTKAEEKFILTNGKKLVKKKGYTLHQAMVELTDMFNEKFEAERTVGGIVRKFKRLSGSN